MRNLLWILFYSLFSLNANSADAPLVFGTGLKNPMIPIASRILDVAYQKLGIQFKVKKYTTARASVLANRGVNDGELFNSNLNSKASINLIKVPVVLSVGQLMLFTKNTALQINGWASLANYSVGSHVGLNEIKQHQNELNNVHLLTNPTNLFTLLERERLDVVILPRLMGLQLLNETKFTDINMLPMPLEENKLYHYLHIKHQELVPQITQVLQAMQDSGELASIKREAELRLLKK